MKTMCLSSEKNEADVSSWPDVDAADRLRALLLLLCGRDERQYEVLVSIADILLDEKRIRRNGWTSAVADAQRISRGQVWRRVSRALELVEQLHTTWEDLLGVLPLLVGPTS